MATYEIFLLLHVISAIIWVGAATMFFALEIRTDLDGDPDGDARLIADQDWLAPRLFIPASMGTLIFGALAAIEGSWDFGQAWIIIGLAGFATSFAIGMGYFMPEGKRLDAAIERHGLHDPEVRRRLSNMKLVGRVELAILYVVVVAMVTKPAAGDSVLFFAMAILVGGAALGSFAWRNRVEQRTADGTAKAPQTP
ncbi:DUF2269 family protein [Thermoleophilia bacterium SCSIO 60948]|nr:DUF2269 family protein [Thermoleophilia bacterium SCSIO 60948]